MTGGIQQAWGDVGGNWWWWCCCVGCTLNNNGSGSELHSGAVCSVPASQNTRQNLRRDLEPGRVAGTHMPILLRLPAYPPILVVGDKCIAESKPRGLVSLFLKAPHEFEAS